MNKYHKAILGGAVALGFFAQSNADASIIYSYVTSTPTYTVAPGGSVTVPIYLQEMLSGGSSSLISADGGLFSGGFSVTRAGTLPASPATLTTIAGSVSANGSNFAGGSFTQDPNNQSTTFVAGDNLASFTATSGPIPNGSALIELGTVTIQAGAAGTTDFTLANYTYPSQGGGYTTTFGNGPGAATLGFDLDVSHTGANAYTGATAAPETFAVSVQSVPEPGVPAALFGLGGVGLLFRRARVVR